MLCTNLVPLIPWIVVFAVCATFPVTAGISWTLDLMCSKIAKIMMAMVITVWRVRGGCWLVFCISSWSLACSVSSCSCVSAMSHPNSGILLFGTAFLPSLIFLTCSSSYSWQGFLVIGIFLTSLQCTLVVCPWLSFTLTWFFPKSPIMQKSLYFGWNALDI